MRLTFEQMKNLKRGDKVKYLRLTEGEGGTMRYGVVERVVVQGRSARIRAFWGYSFDRLNRRTTTLTPRPAHNLQLVEDDNYYEAVL